MNELTMSKEDHNLEIFLLTNSIEYQESQIQRDVSQILAGEYTSLINDAVPSSLIKLLCDANHLENEISNILEKHTETRISWLYVGIASLLRFVQCNWMGIEIEKEISWLKIRRQAALTFLSNDSECDENVIQPELLYLSEIIFSNSHLQEAYSSCSWWLFRSYLINQHILEETSAALFLKLKNLIQDINQLKISSSSYCSTLFNLEATQFYILYRRIQNSEKHLNLAQNLSQLELNLKSALGKRTKYQQEEKPQLYLEAKVEKEMFSHRICQDLPRSLNLNDDVRLESVEFAEKREPMLLGSVESAVILNKFFQLRICQPRDQLTDHEIGTYLDYVIEHSPNWSLKISALYQRCCLEMNHRRTIERSMSQIDHLIQECENNNISTSDKIDSFFVSGMKPIWVLETTHADIMFKIGMIKGSLNIYSKLKLWEQVIECYNVLNLKHKALEIINQEIEKKPTVGLYCMLGDMTNEISHYETAWELSENKSSKVQKHWGKHYFDRKNYLEAIPHLKLSTELNSIQEDVWLRLGFAALQVEDWNLASIAYRRYCALEDMNFEAWNNLAKAYIKLGDKSRAWKCLQDAVKCNYDRWEVWDNLMIVGIDLGHFLEVIRCYHRILDLKSQHLDIQILTILTRAIVDNVKDSTGNPSIKHLEKLLELFGRIGAVLHRSPEFWQLYAELTLLKQTDLDCQKTVQYLQQAHRAALSDSRWFQTHDSILRVLDLCSTSVDIYLRCATLISEGKKRNTLTSAKLSIQGVIKIIKDKQLSNEIVDNKLKDVEKFLGKISDALKQI